MNNNVILTENFLKYSGPNNLFKYSILYGGIFTPYTCKINYVNMQKIVSTNKIIMFTCKLQIL